LQPLGRHHHRHQAGRRRLEEPGRQAAEAGQRGDHGNRRLARDQQRAEQPLRGEPRDVGGHHDRPPRHPIRHDAADQQRGDQRQRAGREHDADVRCRPAQVQHREGERDGDHPVAQHGHGVRAEQQPEVPLPQDGQALGQARHGGRRLSSDRSTASTFRSTSSPSGSASWSSCTTTRGGPRTGTPPASSRCSRAPTSCSR
jgi:hypothetical protein